MILTEQERHSPLWLKLKGEWETKLAKLRTENDGTITEAETIRLRGRIYEIKQCLSMGIEKPKIEIE